jgi:quinol monooxygenase YgiN
MARPVLRCRAYGVVLNPINETEDPMWAQLISARLKPGRDQELPKLFDQLEATEQPGSGLLRSTAFRDQKDPTRLFTLVIFESEEKARAREQDPRRQEGLAAARATMAEVFDGAPEFVDLTVINDLVP